MAREDALIYERQERLMKMHEELLERLDMLIARLPTSSSEIPTKYVGSWMITVSADNAAHQLFSAPTPNRFATIACPSSNTATIQFGEGKVTPTEFNMPVDPGGSFDTRIDDLQKWWYYASNAKDVINISAEWGYAI